MVKDTVFKLSEVPPHEVSHIVFQCRIKSAVRVLEHLDRTIISAGIARAHFHLAQARKINGQRRLPPPTAGSSSAAEDTQLDESPPPRVTEAVAGSVEGLLRMFTTD